MFVTCEHISIIFDDLLNKYNHLGRTNSYTKHSRKYTKKAKERSTRWPCMHNLQANLSHIQEKINRNQNGKFQGQENTYFKGGNFRG